MDQIVSLFVEQLGKNFQVDRKVPERIAVLEIFIKKNLVGWPMESKEGEVHEIDSFNYIRVTCDADCSFFRTFQFADEIFYVVSLVVGIAFRFIDQQADLSTKFN